MAAEALGPLPASFVGDLPCADCPAAGHQLDLYPDQAFVLHTTPHARDGDSAVDEIGSFLFAAEERTLVLMGGRKEPLRFRLEPPDRLRLLDAPGQEVPQLEYVLTRTGSFTPIEPQLRMRGMYGYLADAGRFEECLTRWRLPVAQEADNAALERAYLAARRQPGEALLVELEGRIALRPKMEGEGEKLALVPLRLIGVWPGETCGARFDTAPLENSYWKLTRLGDAPVRVGEREREPHLILRPDNGRLRRRLQSPARRLPGGWRAHRARPGREHHDGLSGGHGHRASLGRDPGASGIRGEHLELFDADGDRLARFERRLMP